MPELLSLNPKKIDNKPGRKEGNFRVKKNTSPTLSKHGRKTLSMF
jgi:hypothetical protein